MVAATGQLGIQTMRDVVGAWLIVGALGLAVVGVWGPGAAVTENSTTVACADGIGQDIPAMLQGAVAPRSPRWRPFPELTGQPVAEVDRPTSYEAAEDRNLEAVGATGGKPAPIAFDHNSAPNRLNVC